MKKLLLVLAIGAFVACNDEGTTEGTGGDTTNSTTTIDSTTITVDTSNRTTVDTSKAGDTTLRK